MPQSIPLSPPLAATNKSTKLFVATKKAIADLNKGPQRPTLPTLFTKVLGGARLLVLHGELWKRVKED
ncbi:uncharacterized protein DS421_9g266450 [Arachis hypogaea]|nr:uncharacterized protein DS421_9g266450 [Arachis hypogaea]